MTVVDSRVRIITLLAQQRPEAVVGIPESEWVDFKVVGPAGPYDLSLDSKKYELAKDVAAFANAAGGLLVCGFKATRRPTDLHETVVKRMPFAKRLVNTERYKAVIADLVRPSIGVEFSWYDDPGDPDLGYLVIEVPALPENARWALVTKTLNEDGRLVKGGVAIPKRHGDDTQYLSPDTVYQLVNSGLRGGPAMDLGLAVEGGAAVDVMVAESVIEALVERRRHALLSSLPQSERRPRRQREGAALPDRQQRAVDELLRLQEIAGSSLSYRLSRDLRTPQQYREEVDAYLEKCRTGLLRMLEQVAALQRDPLVLRLENRSDAMLHQVEVIATLDPGYRAVVQIPDSLPDLNNLPWPEPPVPFGEKTLAARMAAPAGIISSGLPAARRGPSASRLPAYTWSEDGLVIKFPPVGLRARANVLLPLVVLYGCPSTDGAAALRWTATCTNLDGRQEDVARMPVEQLGVTLPPDAEHPELAAN
ncbi:ATP-binding protein [Streptomyces sp. CC219B]|uniref:AlbA family DNA-binding domain-containing protein n=1 Tax=Streptomyces sp. CC219B TaxID=3044574 RepID=UPI0024A960C5|nr:ATP-binding protein [Streptomyces sp. CC219B]